MYKVSLEYLSSEGMRELTNQWSQAQDTDATLKKPTLAKSETIWTFKINKGKAEEILNRVTNYATLILKIQLTNAEEMIKNSLATNRLIIIHQNFKDSFWNSKSTCDKGKNINNQSAFPKRI